MLRGELPQIQAAPVDLGTIVAGQAVPDIAVAVARPLAANGTYPRLVVDLASLGIVDPVPLQHDGQGRYAARGNPVVPRSSPYSPLLSLSEEDGTLFPLSVLNLTVWPAGDLPLLMDGLAAGWRMQGQLKVALDPQTTAQTYEGRSTLAAQTAGMWQVVFSPVETVSPLGYTLHAAFHPGDASGDALDLAIGTKRVNLWPGKAGAPRIDLATKAWQVVEIPFAELDPYQPIKTISFSGKLTGTLYLDDLRLAAGPMPIPPQTAALEERSGARPQAFSLAQNYPNPFNSGTVIPFSLPSATRVEAVVYDLAGQRVATLLHGLRQAGTYAVTWDGRDDQGRPLASGVYLYQFTAGGQQATRKLVLAR